MDFDANVHFGAAAIWDQYDPSKPHKICYLLDEAPLREGVLSASELNAIMAITAGRFLNKHYNHHRVVPVRIGPPFPRLFALLPCSFMSLQRPINITLSFLSWS